MTCVGVDGAKPGWIGVWRQGEAFAFEVYPDAVSLQTSHAAAAVIAVDVPIGLADAGSRTADREARRFVGGRRACSVFSAPVRGILDAASQPEASRRHREIDGRGFGAQAFGILPKVREWDSLLQSSAHARAQVREVHPEVSFAALNAGCGVADRKKSASGQEARLRLLSTVFDEAAIGCLLSRVPRRRAAADDVLDALVALWTAERIAAGHACSLPSPPETDFHGLQRAIWY
jgi:predicted RNase H-like nuclease